MASYFYLMSSLPMLKTDAEVPFSYSEFLSQCENCVSPQMAEQLKNLTPDSSEGSFLSQWHEFYGIFKAELIYQRSQKMSLGTQPPVFRDEQISRIAADAVQDKNPLRAENTLLDYQFKKLDEIIGIHAYDDEALLGYAMKLKLLERKTVFDSANGKAELERLAGGLTQKIMSLE